MAYRGSMGRLGGCLATLAVLVVGAAEDDMWTVSCNKDCDGINTCAQRDLCIGSEAQTATCPDNPKCVNEDARCPPQPCQWGQWEDWFNDGVSGLCTRSRKFTPNRCGGTPCIGNTEESMYCEPIVKNEARDCEFNPWADWGNCDAKTLQRARERSVKLPSAHGGRTCEGPLTVTEPCGERHAPVDCELGDWMSWSSCSRECGGGQQLRMRSIKQQAQHGGRLCGEGSEPAVLQSTRACNLFSCDGGSQPQDCVLDTWGEWSECEEGTKQRYRAREVLLPGANGGMPCQSKLRETASCEVAAPEEEAPQAVDCRLSQWTTWSLCDKTCKGGQTYRRRFVETPAAHGGQACEDNTEETMACNDFPCSVDPESGDCLLTTWSEWTPCSAACGQGIETRQRGIAVEPTAGGVGCSNSLDQVRPCERFHECDKDDCAWSEWNEWTSCTKTCDGGYQSRNRTVVTQPTKGGERCEALESTNELQACNTQQCSEIGCVDGKWGDWVEWEACTRTCGGGIQWRHRSVAVEASPCGNPPLGEETQVQKCSEEYCEGDVDCTLEPWSDWSECSASCYGVQDRKRKIQEYGSGAGKWCTGSEEDPALPMSETRSCNGPRDMGAGINSAAAAECGFGEQEPIDCVAGDWSDWSGCSKSCDGGERSRTRGIAQQARFGGEPCTAVLEEVGGCNAAMCVPPEDCEWGEWSDWGGCSKCDGQRTRTRRVARPGNSKGQQCEAGASKEVAQCDNCAPETVYYCVWGHWQDDLECSATCGSGASRKRTRRLEATQEEPADSSLIVGKVSGDGKCSGTEVNYTACAGLPECEQDICVPQDCEYSQWTDWADPNGCEGVCSRKREIYRPANACGKPCEGELAVTKACVLDKCSGEQACVLGDWDAWTACAPQQGQRTRSRTVAVPAGQNGPACRGPLSETAPCEQWVGVSEAAQDCVLGKWGPWTICSKTCGGGQQESMREVMSHASGGGAACEGSLRRMRPCSEGSCFVGASDCELEPWSDWHGCGDVGDVQAHRKRTLKPATSGGAACSGSVLEAGACPKVAPRDCEWTAWAEWGMCGVTCGGGQRFRTREVARPSENGGHPCTGDLAETESCGEAACSDMDCQVTTWSGWSVCDATCGHGQQTRRRDILQAGEPQGNGCSLGLKEARGCVDMGSHCQTDVDCEWGTWSEWSECGKAEFCGTGFRTRTRKIVQQPQGNGRLCEPRAMEEVVPFASCPGSCDSRSCIDGEWGSWGEWGECTVTCGGGGVRVRSREERVKANDCGRPAEGDLEQYGVCSAEKPCDEGQVVPVDCFFGPWKEFQPAECPARCNGARTRTRTIVRYSEHGGKPCEGPTEESVRCNPSPGLPPPPNCTSGAPVDCKLTEWSEWGDCNANCGTGHKARRREVLTSPEFGGDDCPNPLEEIIECNASVPCVDNSMDCQFADWMEWSSCDPQSGQKMRSREISQHKIGHGLDCSGARKQAVPCERTCQDKQYACAWSDWGQWGACSTTCGQEGRRTRVRALALGYEMVDGKEVIPQAATSQFGSYMTGAPQTEAGYPQGGYLQKYNVLRDQLTATGVRRHQDLALAFAAGLLSLAAGFGLARFGLASRRSGSDDEAQDARSARLAPLAPGLNAA